jgi:hypothetical protein
MLPPYYPPNFLSYHFPFFYYIFLIFSYHKINIRGVRGVSGVKIEIDLKLKNIISKIYRTEIHTPHPPTPLSP